MTDTTNTNELTEQSEKQQATPSLTELDLRDYFAAKAMQGDIAASTSQRPDAAGCAAWAYEMADAMLKAREGER